MNKQNQLVFARAIFVFIISVIFGIIIVTEKAGPLFIPKVQEKLTQYLTNNYSSLEDSILPNTVVYDKTKYNMKITSKENENHFFYI